MREHPIEGLMLTVMDSIKKMIDVNTIIGDPIEANNIVIIPISKMSFGFAAGGSEFKEETIEEYSKRDKDNENIKYNLPFGGGSGAGVSMNPVAFIVVQEENVKLLSVNHSSSIDKLLDYIPDLINKIGKKMNKTESIIEQLGKVISSEDKKQNSLEEKEYEVEYNESDELDD
jgi:sporulation protein YtfJ